MRSTKLEKMDLEIEKTKAKIAELQDKLSEFEQQKTELENDEIITFVRSEKFNETELSEFIMSLRRKGKQASAAGTRISERNKQRTEESRNANKNEN